MQLMLATLKKKGYLFFTLVLTVAFAALYMFLDLRQGGTHNTMLNTHTVTPQYLGDHFDLLYIASSLGPSLVGPLLTAWLIAFTIDHAQMRSGLFSTTVFLGIATFGCPSRILPIAGTLGLIFTAQTLPFFGIEFHVLSLLILLGTFAWLIRLSSYTLLPSQNPRRDKIGFRTNPSYTSRRDKRREIERTVRSLVRSRSFSALASLTYFSSFIILITQARDQGHLE